MRTSRFQAFVDSFGSRNRFVQLSWPVLLALILIAGCWMFFRTWYPSQGVEQELARLNAVQTFEVSPDPSVLVVTLAPLRLREPGDTNRVLILPSTSIVQLRMPVTVGKHQTYRAVLRITGGPEVFKLDGLRVRKVGQENVLVLQIPAKILGGNDYLLTLSGLNSDGSPEEIDEYSFRVVTQQS